MSITVKISPKIAAVAVTDATTEFVTTGPFIFYGDDFMVTEAAYLMRLGPSGEFLQATNKEGPIKVSAYPNMVFVDASGTFRVVKDATRMLASVGFEAQ